MFLHIGEGLLVKKTEVIAILNARKIVVEGNNQLFLEGLLGDKMSIGKKVKSLILVKDGEKQCDTMILMSSIASTTLQKRFHGNIEEMMDIESREIDGKPTKQL